MNTASTAAPPPSQPTKVREVSAFGISPRNWLAIWAVAIIAGTLAYAATVIGSYYAMQSAMRSSPLPQLRGMDQSVITDKEAQSIAEGLRIASPDALAKRIENAINNSGRGQGEKIKDISAFRLLAGLLIGSGRCAGNCSTECIGLIENRVLRLLGGWPSRSEIGLDVFARHQQADPAGPIINIEEACARVREETDNAVSVTDILLSPIGLVSRQNPVPVPVLAEDLLGPGSCETSSQTRNVCQLLIRVMQAIVDSDAVRLRRSLMVNLFYGWERLLVWALFFATIAALCFRGNLFRPFGRRQLAMHATIRELDAEQPLEILDAVNNQDQNLATVGNASKVVRRDFLAEMIDASLQDMKKGATERNVEKIATLHLEEIESERLSIESMIAIFPVIGFVATLLGLIEALASANTIATTTGDERSAAILTVTTVLSSCFATTFLALVFMAAFSVVNMIQGRREKNIVHNVELLLTRLISDHRERNLLDEQARQAELDFESERKERLLAASLEREAVAAKMEAAVADSKAKQLEEEANSVRDRLATRAKRVTGTTRMLVHSAADAGEAGA